MTRDGSNGGPPIADDVPSMAYVKFFPGDFLNGTAHMSLEMVGAYIRTLCVMYDRMGGFPADEHLGSTLLRVDKRVFRRVRDQLLADGKIFFDGDMIRNARVEREISDYVTEYKRRSEAAKRREAERRERQTSAELRSDLSETSGELTAEVQGKSSELEEKQSRKTTKRRAREDGIPEARSQKPEARKEKSNPQTPTGGSVDPRPFSGRDIARMAFAEWQDFATVHGLSVPLDTTFNTFAQAILARMREHANEHTQRSMLAVWRLALCHVSKSKWLRGMTSDFKADLAMIVRPKNFAKLISGGYGNGASAPDARWSLHSVPSQADAERQEAIRAKFEANERILAAEGWETANPGIVRE